MLGRVAAGMLLANLAACTQVEPSGKPFAPAPAPARRVDAAPQAPSSAPAPAAPGEDPFEDERGHEATSDRPLGPEDLMRLDRIAKGLPPMPSAPTRLQPPLSAQTPGASAPIPTWDANMPLPDVSFGVQVMGVLTDYDPPRAIIGLPDGREVVLTPGAMVPEYGLIVLAVGRNGVRLAHVTPNGFQARVQTETIAVLAPAVSNAP